MHQVRIEAEPRSTAGKSASRMLRRAGKLPAVVYGAGRSTRLIQLDTRVFRDALVKQEAEHALINLVIEGEEALAIIKEIQQNPVRRQILHVDFQTIRADREITMQVGITLVGEPIGIEQGGILEFRTRAIDIRTLPTSIPDTLEADVSNLNIGDSLHASDLAIPEGVTLAIDPEVTIATVSAPRILETIEPELGEEEVEEEGEPERVGEQEEASEESESES